MFQNYVSDTLSYFVICVKHAVHESGSPDLGLAYWFDQTKYVIPVQLEMPRFYFCDNIERTLAVNTITF